MSWRICSSFCPYGTDACSTFVFSAVVGAFLTCKADPLLSRLSLADRRAAVVRHEKRRRGAYKQKKLSDILLTARALRAKRIGYAITMNEFTERRSCGEAEQ